MLNSVVVSRASARKITVNYLWNSFFEDKKGGGMKVVILAGGFGSRLSEFTDVIPKPMVPVGGKPMLWHIMSRYAKFDHNEFGIALGYKAEVIKTFFANYREINSDFSVDLATGDVQSLNSTDVDWKVTLIDTGLNTSTGGRLKRMKDFVGDKTFMLTYGDGIADIDIDKLLDFHRSHGKLVTMTAVRPNTRFGELQLQGDTVKEFKEKPQLGDGWINGGFFVIEPQFIDFIGGDEVMLEREPLEKAAKQGQLMAYRHKGFWQCMDTKRDNDALEEIWSNGAPWIN
jgi:glucose-1-phosphate cytidylyltransferase